MSEPEIGVLVADDHELLRHGLVAILERSPALRVVAEAASGTEAVALAREHRPDVVLMDIRMPGIDGIEATRRILRDRGGIAVVILTTFDDDDVLFGALQAGASGFVVKDASTDDVVRAVHAAHRGDALLSPSVTRRIVRAALAGAPRRTPGWEADATPRELEVLALVAAGLSNDEIARQLHVGRATVKSHVSSLLLKTGSRSRVDLVIAAHSGS